MAQSPSTLPKAIEINYSVALCGSPSGNDLRQLAIRSSESNEGANQEVQGNRRVARFHFRDPFGNNIELIERV